MYEIRMRNIECKICNKIFKRYVDLSSHVITMNRNNSRDIHPTWAKYREKYPEKGYQVKVGIRKYCVYVFCDPTKFDNYVYTIFDMIINFPCRPFWIGEGIMGRRYRESLMEHKNRRFNKIIYRLRKVNLIPKIFIIKDNLTISESIKLEKELIYKIGRINHPCIYRKGPLTNMNNGGRRGYEEGEFPKKVRNKISKNLTGKIVSKETREKQRIIAKNRPKPSEETRFKMGSSSRKAYIAISPDGTKYNVVNLPKFCRDYNLSYCGMISVSTGKQNMCNNGWKCYKDNNDGR